ncbi:MAG: hypothetical protein IJ796_09710 [Lachnospiraceae bacterium]|nr:hypothetical protein [Lachnospiraceae bacterium]
MNEKHAEKNRLEVFSAVIFLISCIVFRMRTGDIGLGYMLVCFVFFEAMWIVFGRRVSDAVGNILWGRYLKQKFKSARLIWRYSLSMNFFTGFLVMLFLAIAGSYVIRDVFGLRHSYFLILFFALYFLIKLMSETVGGHLCSRKKTSSVFGAFSVIRQTLILVLGNISISLTEIYGNKVTALLKQEDFGAVYSCIGILITAIVTEILVLTGLLGVKLLARQKEIDYDDDFYHRKDNTGNVFLLVWKRRIYEAAGDLFTLIPVIAGLFIVFLHTKDSLKTAADFGFLTVVMIVPACIVCFLGYFMLLPLVIDIYTRFRKSSMGEARRMFNTGLHLCFVYGAFGAAFLIAQMKIISGIIGPAEASAYERFIVYAAVCSVLLLPTLFVSRLLILDGYVLYTYFVKIPANVIFFVVINIAIRRAADPVRVLGASLLVFFICLFIGFIILAFTKLDMTVNPIICILIPVLDAIVVCVINVFVSKLISPHLGNVFTLLISFIEMAVLYIVLLLLSHNFKETEIKYLPAGRIVMLLGETFRVF